MERKKDEPYFGRFDLKTLRCWAAPAVPSISYGSIREIAQLAKLDHWKHRSTAEHSGHVARQYGDASRSATPVRNMR